MTTEKTNLFFRGIDTGVECVRNPSDVMLIANIDMFGADYYNKLKEYGLSLKPELRDFFDNFFKDVPLPFPDNNHHQTNQSEHCE